MAAVRDTALPLALAGVLTLGAQSRQIGPSADLSSLIEAVTVFVATASWDVVLRDLSVGSLRTGSLSSVGWIRDLRPYFNSHSIVGAAAIAGAVGVLAYSIIRVWSPSGVGRYAAWVLFVSIVVGLPMRVPGWFTELQLYYYQLRPRLTLLTDGMSGLIVALTVVAIRHVAVLYFDHV